MIELTRSVVLPKTGETLTLKAQSKFAPGEAALLRALLAHRGSPYLEHFDEFHKHAQHGAIEDLEWRFYLGEINDRLIATACTWEHHGVGILGHLYTVPEHREKGVSRKLMEFLHEDFVHRRGGILQFNSPTDSFLMPFFESLGYTRVENAGGAMVQQFSEERTEPDTFVASIPFSWRHWPTLHHLFLGEGRPFVRSIGLGIHGPDATETRLLDAYYRRGISRHRHRFQVLEAASSRVVGFASVLPDPRFGGRTHHELLDYYVEPFHRPMAAQLIEAVLIDPPKRIIWHREVIEDDPISPLDFGFTATGLLPEAGNGRDVEIWVWQ